jgi:hypothetical protein
MFDYLFMYQIPDLGQGCGKGHPWTSTIFLENIAGIINQFADQIAAVRTNDKMLTPRQGPERVGKNKI